MILNSNKEKQPKLHLFYLKNVKKIFFKCKFVQLDGTKWCEFLTNKAELIKPGEPQRTTQKLPTPEILANSEPSAGECILPMSS